ncbi:hypothetical protein AB205_0210500 [Aquarana catesbeiana]|uniref:MCM3-like winged helix domain-containing protein n=1 Tax=Aquarana catesbeiana TaxID=8400 RepID=A0A2G9S9Q8_AQUCT|nr:hypothetical protein AB205_0210500 [Aquarana catesbeiana]
MSNRLIQMGAAFVIVHTGSLEVNVDAVAAWTQLQVNLTCWHERMHGSGRTLSAFGIKQFKAALLKTFKTTRSQSVAIGQLLELINKGNPDPFESSEVKKALDNMQNDNQVMVADDVVFLI